ncbi:DUF4339 domain-containing protein [Prosthecobacter sp.]|uniref:DUF4339 domain-containing protein n=1 Tax=Prosthecobacter sp. TaxID=1965333 RepID=UPI00378512CE
MEPEIKHKLDEQLASGLLSIEEYQQKLDALHAADAMMGRGAPSSVGQKTPAAFSASAAALRALPPVGYDGKGLEASARRMRAWFRETPFRWSIAMFIVPWIIRWPLSKLAEKRRAGLKYFYADEERIEGPLSYEEIEACVLAGKIGREMLVIREDSRKWLPLELSEFSFRFGDTDRQPWLGIRECSACPQMALGCLSPFMAVGLLVLIVKLAGMPALRDTLDNRSAGAAWCMTIALLATCSAPPVCRALKRVNRLGAPWAKCWMRLAVAALTITALCLFGLAGYFMFADLSQYGR